MRDEEKYTWTNKRRKASIYPYDEAIETKEQCITHEKLPLVLYYGTDRIIREVPRRGHIKNLK